MKPIAVALAGSLLAVVVSAPAQAYQCKSFPTQAVGVSKIKFKARVKSRKGWSLNVKSQFGLPWSVWKIAKAKSNTCAKINTNIGKQWRCLASGNPCLVVVK